MTTITAGRFPRDIAALFLAYLPFRMLQPLRDRCAVSQVSRARSLA